MAAVFRIDAHTDPNAANAVIACLRFALKMALLDLTKIEQAEWRARLAELEAEVVREIKNMPVQGVDEVEEARAAPIGHASVAHVFETVREIVAKKDG